MEESNAKEYSREEARQAAQDFLKDLGSIKDAQVTSSGGTRFQTLYLEHFGFETENGYLVEVLTREGKIYSLEDRLGREEQYEEYKKPYTKPQLHISREEAVKKLKDFLARRGFTNLELESTQAGDRYLDVSLVPVVNGYVNSLGTIRATLDLSKSGRILRLDFLPCWLSFAYNDSDKEKALSTLNQAKSALKPGTLIKNTELVGRSGENYNLKFDWRFTTEFAGEEYYIYVDALTGKERDIRRVHN